MIRLKRPHTFLKAMFLLIIGMLLLNPVAVISAVQAGRTTTTDTACRFGINSPLGSDGYDVASLGVASYLDWGSVTNPTLSPGVEYIRVLRLRDDLYSQTLANLPAWVQANTGGVWVVGNEPDTSYENQDSLLPEVYADRYYEVAHLIRHLDRTAQIAFGTVVQPTPIRIRYLQRAWDRLAQIAGGTTAASRLVDIWSPHSFILNEQAGAWGTGIPPGFGDDHDDAVIITDFADTHSILIFQQRLFAFRQWMADIGERNKPLWITEYGSLFPPIDLPEPPTYYTISDELTATYMLSTFDFMLSANHPLTGLPADGNQLVQRWFWYSLNDHRYHFGGSLYNPDFPDYGDQITLVGHSFINYQAAHLSQPDLLPLSLTLLPMSYNPDQTLVNYRLEISVDNLQFSDATCGNLWIYNGDPNAGGTLIAGPLPSSAFHADDGKARVTAYWMSVEPLTNYTLYVGVEPIGVSDANPSNNWAAFTVFAGLPSINILPIIMR